MLMRRWHLVWIGLYIFIGLNISQLNCQDTLSTPRIATAHGSNKILHSFANIDANNPKYLTLVYYNNKTLEFSTPERFTLDPMGWIAVCSCDSYHLALASIDQNRQPIVLNAFFMHEYDTWFRQISIPLNVTYSPYSARKIAVSPSGKNFAFYDQSNLYVFEAELKNGFNWTLISMIPLYSKLYSVSNLAMSDKQLRFILNRTLLFTYDLSSNAYSSKNMTYLPMTAIDTLEEHWVYLSYYNIYLEDPLGNIIEFNASSDTFRSDGIHFLPSRLRATNDYFDVALGGHTYVSFGTLNRAARRWDMYNFLPSRSLGLEFQERYNQRTIGFVNSFAVGHSTIVYQSQDLDNSISLAVPSSPGNHSCSQGPDYKYGLTNYWCGQHSPTHTCPAGTYQPSFGFQACLLCPDSTYQPRDGAVACIPCRSDEYCPMGTFQPEPKSLSTSYNQTSWNFPLSDDPTSLEEIVLVSIFASSFSDSNVLSVSGHHWRYYFQLIMKKLDFMMFADSALSRCSSQGGNLFFFDASESSLTYVPITVLLISVLIKYHTGVDLHGWLAKIDIHKKTKHVLGAKSDGTSTIRQKRIGSVFGGYMTLLAVYLILTGSIMTIIFVSDYHPLLIGASQSTEPSKNSQRTASNQDFSTQSKSTDLANSVKDNISLNITIKMFNFRTEDPANSNILAEPSIQNCFNIDGNRCNMFQNVIITQNFPVNNTESISIAINGPVTLSDMQIKVPLIEYAYFTFATVRIDASFCTSKDKCHFQPSFAQYALLPGQNKKLTDQLIIPVSMIIVVRETEVNDEFERNAYISFVSDSDRFKNMGHSNFEFEQTNGSPSFVFEFNLANNWRLEAEHRRFGGAGAFFAALLAILGLYEVTLLVSELVHRVYHVIKRRQKKRKGYESVLDKPLIVNEKHE